MSARRIRAVPWAALLISPAVWFLYQQALAGPLRLACGLGWPWLGPAFGVASLMCCALAARIALPWTRAPRSGRPVDAWIARVALLIAAVLTLPIMFQTLAAVIVPPCVR